MDNFAVKMTNISKKYVIHHEKPTLIENVLQKKTKEEFFALKNINLTIQKGDKVGIIGPNGSGKTTLLKIIAGITASTTGTVKTTGKVVSLIELGAGFQPDLTGEENIILNGLLIGMSKEEIQYGMRDIKNFADIGSFIDAPFYTYSSGMALRLGFSIAINSNPDIFILDENIAVGDEKFQKKSFQKLQNLFKKNKTIIVASHMHFFLDEFCNRIISLDKGIII